MSIKVREGGAWVEVSSGGSGGSSDPIGTIVAWASSTPPTGWLECNGQSTSGYTELAALIGSNVPDLRGEFVRGWDNSAGVDAGRALLSTQSDEFESHNHTINSYTGGGGPLGGHDGSAYNGSITTSSQGGTETRPRNVSLMYIIKHTATSGGSGGGGSGQIIKNGSYVTGHGVGAQTIIQTTTWTSLKINGGTGQVAHNITKPSADVLAFNKVSNNSHLEIACYFPVYINYADNYNGIRLMSSHDGGSNYYQTSGLTEGPYSSWGAAGGENNSADGSGFTDSSIVSYVWHTSDNTSQSSTWSTKTGECRFYFQVRNYSQPTGFISYWIDYTNVEPIDYPRVGKVIIREVVQ